MSNREAGSLCAVGRPTAAAPSCAPCRSLQKPLRRLPHARESVTELFPIRALTSLIHTIHDNPQRPVQWASQKKHSETKSQVLRGTLSTESMPSTCSAYLQEPLSREKHIAVVQQAYLKRHSLLPATSLNSGLILDHVRTPSFMTEIEIILN